MSKYLSITTTTREAVWINIDNIVSIKNNSKIASVIEIHTNAVGEDGEGRVFYVKGSLASLMGLIGASVVAF